MSTDIVGSKQPTFASDQLRPDRSGYGQNAYGGASSDTPKERTRAGLTVNRDGDDPVLETIKAHGSAAMRGGPPGDSVETVRGTPATQIRDIGNGNVPDHPAMASNRSRQPSYPGPNSNVPAGLADDEGEPGQP